MLLFKPQPRLGNEGDRTFTRNLVLGGIFVLWMTGLIARLYYLQVIQYVQLLGRAQRQQQRTVEIAPQRGTIFDREMRPLAMSLSVDSVYAVPALIPNLEIVARLLGPVLGLPPAEILGRFKAFRSFCWIKRRVSTAEATRVRELNLQGIYFQKEMKRFYPKRELAAHVLGAVGLDDAGLAGLEYALNDEIRGQASRVLVAYDAHGQSFRSAERRGRSGKNVVLTLDENIQYTAERALAEGVARWHAAWGTALVQDPNTGEILAMASQPTFDPNEFARSSPGARINRAVSIVYEPGSTFKLVTVAAALEEGLTTPEEVIDCQRGSIVLAGHVIHDYKPFGSLTVREVLAKSSDVGAIKLGLRLGEERLHRYARSFGFGAKTEVELPGEDRGLLKSPANWSGISIGEISTGQEVAVTPLQLVTAYSAIVNGGILLPPHIVRDVFRDRAYNPPAPASGRRIASERTAALMRRMLEGAVASGTGLQAQLNGYRAAGKTGTAQKIDSSGRYSKSHFVSSFVGFAPASEPAVTILVVIDSPVGAIHGGEVAAPVFRSIAEQTLGYLTVPQDNPSKSLQVASRAPARFPRHKRGYQAGFHLRNLEPPGAATSPIRTVAFRAFVPGRGGVASTVRPRPVPTLRRPVEVETTVLLERGPLLTVPSFSTLAVRQVAMECQRLGLELNVSGTGLAVEQNPPAGTRVRAGAQLWVRFSR